MYEEFLLFCRKKIREKNIKKTKYSPSSELFRVHKIVICIWPGSMILKDLFDDDFYIFLSAPVFIDATTAYQRKILNIKVTR